MIPRLTLIVELEAQPAFRLESLSAEDEAALLAWLETIDLAAIGAAAAERITELRTRTNA